MPCLETDIEYPVSAFHALHGDGGNGGDLEPLIGNPQPKRRVP